MFYVEHLYHPLVISDQSLSLGIVRVAVGYTLCCGDGAVLSQTFQSLTQSRCVTSRTFCICSGSRAAEERVIISGSYRLWAARYCSFVSSQQKGLKVRGSTAGAELNYAPTSTSSPTKLYVTSWQPLRTNYLPKRTCTNVFRLV